jgi:hypothetical protein
VRPGQDQTLLSTAFVISGSMDGRALADGYGEISVVKFYWRVNCNYTGFRQAEMYYKGMASA